MSLKEEEPALVADSGQPMPNSNNGSFETLAVPHLELDPCDLVQVCDLVTYIVDNYDGIERSACEKDILGLLHDLLKEDLIELCEAE